jgi:hypothetical protein
MSLEPRLVTNAICPPEERPKVALGLVVPTRTSSTLSIGMGIVGSAPMPPGLTGCVPTVLSVTSAPSRTKVF